MGPGTRWKASFPDQYQPCYIHRPWLGSIDFRTELDLDILDRADSGSAPTRRTCIFEQPGYHQGHLKLAESFA